MPPTSIHLPVLPTEPTAISWQRILLFMVVATVLCNVFRFDVFALKPALQSLPVWLFILVTVVLEGGGVMVGAWIALSRLKQQRRTDISLFGTSSAKSLAMVAIPIVLLTALGVDNDHAMQSHLYGFMAVSATLLYCVLEEYGWRGYLQEELKALKPWHKYLVVGFLWYVWHLTFLTAASIGENLFFLAMMVFGSWGIGQVADATRSILACACFHLIIQIMMFNALIKNGLDGTEKLVVLGVSVTLWFLIIKKWERDSAGTQTV